MGWMSPAMAHLVLDIPERTIRTWVQRGQVASRRDDGGNVYVKMAELERRVEKWRKRRV